MGSELLCESVKGEGSTFHFELNVSYFQLPIQKQPPLAVDQVSTHLPPTGKKVLVVEDNVINMHLMRTRLRLLDKTLKVLEAKTGQEAIALFDQERPDLVFTDIKLPDIDGYQVAKAIRVVDSKIPIIALSAMAWSGEKQEHHQAGIREMIRKPFSESEIKRVLKEYLSEADHEPNIQDGLPNP